MMEKEKILEILNEHYSVCFDSLEFVRDSGSMAYAVFSGRDKYFLRITKPAFFDTVHKSLEIHVFLMKQGFSVPPVIFTRDGSPCGSGTGCGGNWCFAGEISQRDEGVSRHACEAG